MTIARTLLSRLARAVLLLTTVRCRFPLSLPEMARGWQVRLAALRWDIVWRDSLALQVRARVIVMPMPEGARIGPHWGALLRHRRHLLALCPEDADPALVQAAEQELFRRIAPPWTDRLTGPEQ